MQQSRHSPEFRDQARSKAAERGSRKSEVRLHVGPGAGIARDAEFNGAYHDVHCWVFTPQSFAALCCELAGHGVMHFECEWIDDTRRNELEFLTSLKPARSAALALQSWQEALAGLAPA